MDKLWEPQRLDAAGSSLDILLAMSHRRIGVAGVWLPAPGSSGEGLGVGACMAGLTHALSTRILKQMLDQSATLDLMFHALADSTRRGMVERLSRGPASVSELAQPLDMTLSAVVQHLQVLEASGLVRSQKVGRVRTCRIEPMALRRAEQWIAARRTTWERRLDRLGDYLAEHPAEPDQRG
jgi:DNA-binding transcriptional ArsR family regulator